MGIALAIILAGGMGVFIAQAFPSGAGVATISTATESGTSTLISTATAVSTVASVATSTTTALSTSPAATSTAAASTTTTAVSSETTTATVTSTAITTSTVSSATSTSSTTLPCSSPGVQCGSFQIMSATLVAYPGADSASNLTITLANTGNADIGSFEVFLNYNTNSSMLLGGILPAGQQVTWSFSVQNANFLVSSGETYNVLVEAFFIGSGHITANLWSSVEVVATATT